jgi:hypothetical protein
LDASDEAERTGAELGKGIFLHFKLFIKKNNLGEKKVFYLYILGLQKRKR